MLKDLTLAEYNPRTASDKDRQDLSISLDRFSLADPIIINRNNRVIGGHFRLNVLRERGIQEVDVRVPNRLLALEEEKELNLRLNKNTGAWDFGSLGNFNEEVLLDVGFNVSELDNIFDLEIGKTDKDDTPDAPEAPISKLGDVYKLGDHRIMCGDSTDQKHLEALLSENGQVLKADLIFTDPPYNVNYSGKGENTSDVIENDNLSPEAFNTFISKAFEGMYQNLREGGIFYICSGWSSYPVFYENLIKAGLHRAGVIIWVKNNAAVGWNDYRYKHEWILVGKRKKSRMHGVSIMYGWKKGEAHYFRSTRDEYDVWEVPREHAGNYKHPTQKPVWLIEKAIANSSERGQIVLDPFGGSGSTLIAAERLKRRAFLCEYDAKYVDVIIARWENFTGKKAEKLNA